jgi:glycine/D-amino acid oxidase-like deaminating enzyme
MRRASTTSTSAERTGQLLITRRGLIAGGASLLAMPALAREWKPACPYPVNASPDRLIRSTVGLRPFRPSGFRVEREALGAKTIVHNYGHGGGGITLCWGTGKLAIDLGLPGHAGPVAVIGSGAVGLATARLCQEAGYPVTIYTAALPPETTSNLAGGQWFPAMTYASANASTAYLQQLIAASNYAYRRYQIMTGEAYGIRWMRKYYMDEAPNDAVQDPALASMLPQARLLSAGENPFPFPWVRQWDGLLIEPPRFLRAMLQDFHIAGGRVVVRKLADRNQIAALPETLIFNCSGLGARDLVGDAELTPVRGQLAILEPQPEVDYATISPGGLYMFSRADGVVLGGTHDEGAWDTTPDPDVTARILAGHQAVFGKMRCRPKGPRPLLS